MNTTNSIPGSLLRVLLIVFGLLLIPLIAMQFTNEVVWTLSDFVIAGTLLFGTGLSYVLITTKAENFVYKMATGLALVSVLFLIWANLAVGLIGSENNPENLMYFAVILIGMIGAGISRFKPKGMMLTLFAMAASMVIIALIAFALGAHHYPYSSTMEILGVTAFFTVPFILSGLLYRNAAGFDVKDEINE
ncbi:MAG: hypothetical protein ACMZ7B_06015 [Balneola sp.]